MSEYGKWPKVLGKTSINPRKAEHRSLLSAIQGNILQGHGRNFSTHYFLRFDSERWREARRFIHNFSHKYVTSALEQFENRIHYENMKVRGRLFASFFLTSAGYQALGLPMAFHPADARFRAGMKASRKRLTDPPPAGWVEPFRAEARKPSQVHAMVLLADDDQDYLREEENTIFRGLPACGEIIGMEEGMALRRDGHVVEHFGYADGQSQPVFLQSQVKREKGRKYRNKAKLGLVLVDDPLGDGQQSFGSYLVFRKLKQDVRRFEELVEKSAAEVCAGKGLRGEEKQEEMKRAKEMVRAFVVGRFPNGTSLVEEGESKVPSNNFNYQGEDGKCCPLQAHVRRMNPRTHGDRDETGKVIKDHRIVRRGITYGERAWEPGQRESLAAGGDVKDLPAVPTWTPDYFRNEVGLLFMCYQGDIAEQFEYLQERANGHSSGTLDPLIGQWRGQWLNGKPRARAPVQQRWLNPGLNLNGRGGQPGGPARNPIGFSFHSVVQLRGGEYFFAPSMSFLTNVGELMIHEELEKKA